MAIGFDEDEKFRQMLGGILGNGPAPYDVTTSMEQQPQQQFSAPYMPESAQGIGGYTPPPAAAPPQYLDRVQGHQFGGGDIAMLGGILAALLGGGKHRGEIAGSLAGQYGGAVMQANGRADQRNQQVDQFNAQLAAKDDPLARWKADQEAQYRSGNLKSRADELALQKTREDRIGAAQAAEDAKDPVAEAERIARARGNVALDITRQKNDMEVGTREMLGQILGKQKGEYASPTGKGASGMDDPAKALKAKLAENALAGMTDGSVDPLTGKPVVKLDPDGNPVKPPTAASAAAAKKLQDALAPYEGTEVADESVWKPIAGNPTIREKSRRDDAAIAGAVPALDEMIKLRKANGTETGFGEDSGNVTAAFDVERGKVESALGVLKNIGVISPTEAANLAKTIPTIGPGLSDASRLVGMGDSTLGKLEGARDEWVKLTERARSKYGLRAKSATTEQPLGESADGGIKFSVDPDAEKRFNAGEQSTGSGTKLVQLISPSGARGSRELTDAQLQGLLATGWKVAQ
jgi:hypothetical protein